VQVIRPIDYIKTRHTILASCSMSIALCNIVGLRFVSVARVQIPAGPGPGIHFWDRDWLSSGGRPGMPVRSISHCAPSALISPPFRTGGKKGRWTLCIINTSLRKCLPGIYFKYVSSWDCQEIGVHIQRYSLHIIIKWFDNTVQCDSVYIYIVPLHVSASCDHLQKAITIC
jgi:hypothetical protein